MKEIQALAKPGLYGDGGTLYLHVAPGGSKSWIQRLVVHGRRRDIGLGGFPLVRLSEARDLAFKNRRLARRGGDPLAERRRADVPTFREAAESTFEANRPRWRNVKHISQWMQTLERHAMPKIGAMPVDTIGQADVLRVLTPIWTTHAETARKVRQRIRAVLGWAQAHGYINSNAAGEGISAALPTMPKQKQHYRALPYSEVTETLAIITASRASVAAKLAFRFLVLAATCSGEVRGAAWSEVNVKVGEWRIPASRMKGGREHRVPLSDAALEVLREARTLGEESDLVFPSPSRRGRPMSDMTLTKLLRDNGLADRCTVHGFRTSFRTWASERTNAEHAVMELSLAHAVGSQVERAYSRSDLLAKRRRLMDQWADYITGIEAKLVRLHG